MAKPTGIRWLFQEKLQPWLALTCLLAVGGTHYGAEYLGETHQRLHALLEAFASCFEAGFIAAFLALAVDPVLKSQLVGDSLLQVVFRFAYGYTMPDEVQQFWEERVVKEEFIRRKVSIHWHLCPSAGNKDRIEVQLHMSFKPANFTGKKLAYKHVVFATSDSPDKSGQVLSMYCESEEKNESYFYPDQAALEQHRVQSGYEGAPIELLPHKISTKQVICGAHYRSEGARQFGTDRVTFTQFSANVRVTVSVDDALKDLKLSLLPPPDDQERTLTPKVSPKRRDLCCEWDFHQRLFIPNERLLLRWEDPAVSVPESAPAQAKQA